MRDIIRVLRRIHGSIHDALYKKKYEENMKADVLAKQRACCIRVLSIDDTLAQLEKGKSMCRFGDGEMEIILGNGIGFQKQNADLGQKLIDILSENADEQIVVCVPDALVTLDNLTDTSIKHWVQNMTQHFEDWMHYLNRDYTYGTTNVTRCYMRYKDKTNCLRWFSRLQNLWFNKDIVIVEGYETRAGIGNDMFDNSRSIQRILCPSENAFEKYDEILSYIINNVSKNAMILIALGPTATVLSWDLAKKGYRALDIGHCDIEYSWCKMGLTEKRTVKGKYTNEVTGGNVVEDITDNVYSQQIIKTIQ